VKKKSEFLLKAFTFVYDRLIPDKERQYVTLLADYLDIPIHFFALDDEKWFGGWDRASYRFPEPMPSAMWNHDNCVRRAALDDDVRVFYKGLGPDAMLTLEPTHYLTLLRHGRIVDLIKQTGGFVLRYRQRPPLFVLAAVRRWRQRLRGIVPDDRNADVLALLAPSVAELVDIPKRWWQFPEEPQAHPWRPRAYSQLTDHYWTLHFQIHDAATWHAPVEFRFPYFDLRLVRYLLRVPVLPWCSSKALLREAMRARLPEGVRTRQKAPLAGEPSHAYADWVYEDDAPGVQLGRYVDISRMPRLSLETASARQGTALTHRLIALNHWLKSYQQQAKNGLPLDLAGSD
jgi:asparagine synthase (glutamine-hydrolysing)